MFYKVLLCSEHIFWSDCHTWGQKEHGQWNPVDMFLFHIFATIELLHFSLQSSEKPSTVEAHYFILRYFIQQCNSAVPLISSKAVRQF